MSDFSFTQLTWAAYLLAGWWGGPAAPGPQEVDAAAVVRLLRRNSVPLLTLAGDPRPDAAALLATPAFAAALDEDRRDLACQEVAFGEIVARWQAAGIPALFVKALGPQPTFAYTSSNLDVLVPQAQQDAARKIVRDLGYVELRHIEEPNKFLFRRFHLGESAFDIHVHGRLEWTVSFLDEAEVWQHSRLAPDTALAAVPAAGDAVLITLAHAIYENKSLKLSELAKVLYAASRLEVDWERAIAMARRKGWADGLWFGLVLCDRFEETLYGVRTLPAALLEHAWRELPPRLRAYVEASSGDLRATPLRISFVESKRLFYAKMLADTTLLLRGRLRDTVFHTLAGTRLRLRLRSQRPMLIALDGLDGCGKSLQTQLLDRALTGAAVRHRIVWSRGGSSDALQPFLRLGKRVLSRSRRDLRGALTSEEPAEGASGAPREAGRAVLFSHPLVQRLWPWLIALELGVRYLGGIRWPLLRGEVVVADRYLLSALAELGARLGRPNVARSAAGRWLRFLAPTPRHSFWLDVPVAVAAARGGGEESAAHLARQAELLPALAAELGASRIDGTLPPDVISACLVTGVLREYLDAHRTLLNAFFWTNPRPLTVDWQTALGDSEKPCSAEDATRRPES